MATRIDIRDFFNCEEFSDVTFEFEDSNEKIKCHRIILASKSEQFKALLKDETVKKDGAHTIIKLKMDHGEIAAFKATIRYIYTFDYVGEGEDYKQGSSTQWWFQVNVAHTASRYGILSLEEKAISKLHESAQAQTNTGVVKGRMTVLWDHYREYTKQKLQPTLSLLGELHGTELKQNPYFALLTGNEEMIITCVFETAPREQLIKKLFRQCLNCGKGEIVEVRTACGICCETTRTCRTVWVRSY